MNDASRDRIVARPPLSRVRALAAGLFLAAFAVILLLGVRDAARRTASLDERRDQALAGQSDPVEIAGAVSAAFRRVRSTIGRDDRFALVFGPEFERDQQGFYRLVALSSLYPAIATADPGDADAVMVFGAPSPSIRARFDEIGVVEGVWLGRRRA